MNNLIRRFFNQTLLAVFAAILLCAAVLLAVFLFVFHLKWEQFEQRYLTDHLNESLSRIAREIREFELYPPLTNAELQHLARFAKKENVLIRWLDSDGNVVIDMIGEEPGLRRQSASAPVWIASVHYGTLYVEWESQSGNAYPLFSMNQEMKRALRFSGLIAVICTLLIGAFAAFKLSSPISRLSSLMDQLYRTQKLPPVHAEGTKEIKRLAFGYNLLSKQLEEQEKWRRILMEDLAHEFRTPLSVVSNQIEAMVDGIFEMSRSRLEMVLFDLYRLNRLVQDIEQVIQANGARFELHLSETDMVPLVKRAIFLLQEAADAKKIELTLHTPKVPCPVLVDLDKTTQIFINLIHNAIKFTPEEGRIEVEVEPEDKAGMIAVHVRDNGIGIAKDDLTKIFDRFYRAEHPENRDVEGSGLGLTITRRLVEAHEGRIEVKSELGVGSRFSVYLPTRQTKWPNLST
jgi:signal transduction histidine kinase